MRFILRALALLMVMAATGIQGANASTRTKTLLIPGDGELTISWQVRTHGEGVRLRLYAINRAGRPNLLTEEQASRGTDTFRFVDTRPRTGAPVQYRLSFVTPDGLETALAEIRCVEPGIQMGGMTPTSVVSPDPLCNPASHDDAAPDWSRTSPAAELVFVGRRPAPQVPPPRTVA